MLQNGFLTIFDFKECAMSIKVKSCLLVLLFLNAFFIQEVAADEDAQVFNPKSSISNHGDAGYFARTHFKILVPPGGYARLSSEMDSSPMIGPPSTALANIGYDTQGSLACRYGLTSPVAGCSALNATNVPSGGSGAIAIVLAYHYPNALKDLTAFSIQFGLTTPNLKVVYASGSKNPPANSPGNWEIEGALDLQWAHAMAPNAQLILVEAQTNANADLLKAVDVATQQLNAGSGGQVNMSWGGPEFATEISTANESHFAANPYNQINPKPIVYFASSGDGAGTSWPFVSPNVVCVGGTTVRKDPATGQLIASVGTQTAEVAWNLGGGGISAYFTKPFYQKSNPAVTMREVPDVALAADPLTGAWVYYTNSSNKSSGWYLVGGTSWSSPAFAGIVNNKSASSSFPVNSAAALTNLYNRNATFTDVQSGWCGSLYSYSAASGWDNCTGVGLPNGNFIP